MADGLLQWLFVVSALLKEYTLLLKKDSQFIVMILLQKRISPSLTVKKKEQEKEKEKTNNNNKTINQSTWFVRSHS